MNRLFSIFTWFLDKCIGIFPRKFTHQIARCMSFFLYITLFRYFFNSDTKTIQKALSVSHKQAKKIALNGFANLCVFLVDYQFMALASIKKVSDLMDTTNIVGLDHIQDSINSNRPIILASIHMDSFMIGVLKLCKLIPSQRHVAIIKFNSEKPKEIQSYAKFKELGANISVIRLNENPALEILKQLRAGNLIFIMCDVNPKLGKTVSVEWFGKSAHFHCGLVELAIATKALILPLVVSQSSNTSKENYMLTFEPPIDPLLVTASGFQEKTMLMSQLIASHIETWVKRNPGQWHSWGILTLAWNKE